MILAPAAGVPSEDMLQDTLKSGIIALMTLGTALLFLWQQRRIRSAVVWHRLMWLPLGLAAYASLSMFWSHAYLGGVEASRWLLFSLLLWLGMNIRVKDLEGRLLWGIHWGVTMASIWTAWQFWGDFNFFPQGPNPASTFINRNFFAEYAICALPYSLLLTLRTNDFRETLCLSAGLGFNVSALLMTGTRSALIALMVLCVILPTLIYRFWKQLPLATWGHKKVGVIFGVGACSLLTFASIPTANHMLLAEFGAQNALSRSLGRATSLTSGAEYTTGSFSIRSGMWAATLRMAMDYPITGVGAGGWEVHIPRYQTADSLTETDYYAHNEMLQLLAEYGVTGASFIIILLLYLSLCAYRMWADCSDTSNRHIPIRTAALGSLLMLLIVSSAGFPWRMACTGAIFALSLAFLAATDGSLAKPRPCLLRYRQPLQGVGLTVAMAMSAGGLVLAVYGLHRASLAERSLVRSAQLAVLVGGSPDPRSVEWDAVKGQILAQAREGIELNPHYRKITPVIGDQLASWGDWKNALWIWESVQKSRPNVIAIICNISRAHMELGDIERARAHFVRAQELHATSKAVFALNVELLAREGKILQAMQLLEVRFQNQSIDDELALLAYKIGKQGKLDSLVVRALQWRIQHQPERTVSSWLILGQVYDQRPGAASQEKALNAYRSALEASPEKYREVTRERIPRAYRKLLEAQ